MANIPTAEICPGCGHPMSLHVNDVTGRARCFAVERGVSSSGVLGLPYERHCPCADFKVPDVRETVAEAARRGFYGSNP